MQQSNTQISLFRFLNFQFDTRRHCNAAKRNELSVRAFFAATLFALPSCSSAVQIGDIVAMSQFGEPLRIEISLTTTPNEQIDSGCLSLIPPEANTADTDLYQVGTRLSLEGNGATKRVLLKSTKPFNEVFAQFNLAIKCQGQGSITKRFTFLPDINVTAPNPEQSQPAPDNIAEPTPQIAANSPPDLLLQSNLTDAPVTVSIAPSVSSTARPPRKRNHAISNVAPRRHPSRHRASPQNFQLKISGALLDPARIGKISKEEREQLLAQQQFPDTDDQMASILSLQHQVQQLQEDLSELRAKFAQLDTAPARVNNSLLVAPNPRRDEVAVQPMPTLNPKLLQQTSWRDLAWQLTLLIMVICGVAWGFIRSAKTKSSQASVLEPAEFTPTKIAQPLESWQVETHSIVKPAPDSNQLVELKIPEPVESLHAVEPLEFTSVNKVETLAPAIKPPPVGITTGSFSKFSAPTQTLTPDDEANAIIEEAQLYATHNHPLRAIKILEELIVEQPKKTEGWLLLLGISSSLSRTNEFERTARDFLKHHTKNSETWKTIQALGRTLDVNNPLYEDEGPQLSPEAVLGDRHQIGDILIDLEMILPETLHQCLADFDAKKHGRFGAYLVVQKVITHEQLTQALVHQQHLNHGAVYINPEPADVVDISEPLDFKFEVPERNWHG